MSEVASLKVRSLVHVRRQGDIEAELEKKFEQTAQMIRKAQDISEWNLDGPNPSLSLIWPLEWDGDGLLENTEGEDPYLGE